MHVTDDITSPANPFTAKGRSDEVSSRVAAGDLVDIVLLGVGGQYAILASADVRILHGQGSPLAALLVVESAG